VSYKTILVHVDRSRHAAARIALAARVAAACRAHLTGTAFTGLSRYAQLSSAGANTGTGLAWTLPPDQITLLREQARADLAAFDGVAAVAGLDAYSTHLQEDEAGDGLLLQAPYSDLLVVSQTDADAAPAGATRPLPPYLLLNAGRPLLLAPCQPAAVASGPFQHPLLAWDGSRAAARAFGDALPLLKLARRATVLMLNVENDPAVHGPLPGADMALFLARHGVEVELMQEFTRAAIGEALLSVAGELSCDLLVMGGYGHQRHREALLGGTTRDVLRDAALPVLMSH
jgi:nucleotide-binding universal stress UspA family protein